MTSPIGMQEKPGRGAVTGKALETIVRRHLELSNDQPVTLEEVIRHTNLNHIYKVQLTGRSIYVKVVPERPKRLPIALPRERVFGEAEAIRKFQRHASGAVLVPDVLFVDENEFVLGMTDVGRDRQVLFDVLDANYSLHVTQAPALGRALGAVHSGTAGIPPFRPAEHDRLLRAVIFQGLIAPGAAAAFPELADRVLTEMARRRECLVHADLWGKNILVGEGIPPAIVDFEGAFVGDAAFDVATVLATSLLPVLSRAGQMHDCQDFAVRFLWHYREAYADPRLADEVLDRTFFYVGTLMAARGFGPFAYPMSDESKLRLALLARNLTEFPPASPAEYAARIAR